MLLPHIWQALLPHRRDWRPNLFVDSVPCKFGLDIVHCPPGSPTVHSLQGEGKMGSLQSTLEKQKGSDLCHWKRGVGEAALWLNKGFLASYSAILVMQWACKWNKNAKPKSLKIILLYYSISVLSFLFPHLSVFLTNIESALEIKA